MIRASDKKLIRDFEDLVEIIKSSTSIDPWESAGDKARRIALLLSDYEKFATYYFPEYCFAPFAFFHKEIPSRLIKEHSSIWLLQWSREFAKSTHAGLFLPLYLKFTGQLNGMLVGSINENVAADKLSDLQANLEANQRVINDFGEQMSWGNWVDGAFKTKDDVGFYAFGKKQSPRGTRFKFRRPNYGLVDDLNDTRQLKNETIAAEDKRWVMEELKPALWIRKWWLVIAQNKFHANTVTALIEDDPEIKKNVSRVDFLDAAGNCNWPENFTPEQVEKIKETDGFAGFQRERQNTPMDEGTTFKEEWLLWVSPLPFNKYDGVLVHYVDPSYKGTETSDYKAWVLIGKTGLQYHILKAWVEKASSKLMWEHAYDVDAWVGEANTVKHAMEAGFIQEDIHGKELDRVAEDKGRMLRCQYDYRKKPDKKQRIESLAPLFQRGLIRFNEDEKGDPGMRRLRSQLLAFGDNGVNDDGPDALEGAIWFIDRFGRKGGRKPRSGKFNVNKTRTI